MENVEIEYKMLLTKEQYNLIKEDIKSKAEKIEQTNIYFDTKDRQLAAKKQALRIRIAMPKGYELTLKEKREKDQLEHNFDISSDDYNLILAHPDEGISEYLPNLSKGIIVLGQLKNTRLEWHTEQGTFALDHSKYNGIEDYEIEFEAKDYESENVLVSLLETYNIQYKANHKNKIQRFSETTKIEALTSIKAFEL
ncbi:CYTH domain-containing protein [Mycoplasma sp. P36-A1]|uniref:CYTH domain-containing protein n=1 Tax=Mycoplasma sp. P36-A1 TaxID=3252900 RepID=UPI003C2D82A1